MILPRDRQPFFSLYSLFTLGIALLFLGFYFFEDQLHWWQASNIKLLPIVLSAYLSLAIVNLMHSQRNMADTADVYLPNLLAEILIYGFLIIYLAPLQEDLNLLLLISIGLGNLIVGKRFGYLLAAMATIMVLSGSFINSQKQMTDHFLSGSFISILFFVEAFIIQALKDRLSEAEHDAQYSQNRLHNIARINDLIIERMQTGVCVVNNAGLVLSINRAAIERIGNLEPLANLPEPLIERLQDWEKHKTQNENSLQITLENGSRQAIIASFAAIDEGSSLVFIEDKSTVVRRAHNFKLASLARMAASIAHEIRNPLSAISHASQLLEESEELSKEDKHLCEIIQKHCTRMELIIQNVLQISRRNQSETQWIPIISWLDKFKIDFEKHHNSSIEITGHETEIRFDQSQLHQALWNLCSNAVRYGNCDPEHPVKIQIDQQDHRALLSVIDHGKGIKEEEQAFLFEPFHTTSVQGTGLGLYLVKELCEANHAEIRYYHGQQGATFEIAFSPNYETHKDNS